MKQLTPLDQKRVCTLALAAALAGLFGLAPPVTYAESLFGDTATEWKLVSIRRALDGGSPVFELESLGNSKVFVVAHAHLFEPYAGKPQVISVFRDSLEEVKRVVIAQNSAEEQNLLVVVAGVLDQVAGSKAKPTEIRDKLGYLWRLLHIILERDAPWPW